MPTILRGHECDLVILGAQEIDALWLPEMYNRLDVFYRS